MARTWNGSGPGSAPVEGITGREAAPFGWTPLIVLFLVGLVDRIETYITSGVLPLLQQEWGFGDTVGGLIMTAPLIIGALALVPAGIMADRCKRTSLIAVIVALWSFITLGSALAPVFALFFLSRILLGASDTIDNPAGSSLLADYYPPRTRAKVYGWVRLTNYAGVALGSLLGTLVGAAFGWRWAFAVMVVPGLIVAWMCWRLREPARGFLDRVVARDTGERVPVPEAATAEAPRGTRFPRLRAQMSYIMSIPTLLMVSVGLLGLSVALTGIFYWIPSLIYREFGLPLEQAGIINAAVILVGVVGGAVFGGHLGGRWHGTYRGGRLLAGGGAITLNALLLIPALLTDSLAVFVAFLITGSFVGAIAIPNLFASLADVMSAHSRGIGFAFLNFLAIGGGALGPVIIGGVSDATGSLTAGMFALIPLMVIGGVFVLFARGAFERDAENVLAQARKDAQRDTSG